jgi:hypothetical protein
MNEVIGRLTPPARLPTFWHAACFSASSEAGSRNCQLLSKFSLAGPEERSGHESRGRFENEALAHLQAKLAGKQGNLNAGRQRHQERERRREPFTAAPSKQGELRLLKDSLNSPAAFLMI